MNVAAIVERGRKEHPARPAIIFEGDAISYARLDEMANRAANSLRALGIKPGDRVVIALPNTPAFVFVYLGALKIGAIAVSVNPGLRAEEIGAIAEDSGASSLIAEDASWNSFEDRMSAASPEADALDADEDTPAAILYTSGTTGVPKGATLSHGNILFNAASKKRYLEIQPADRLLLFLPVTHCFGQNAILTAALYAGASVVLHRNFDAGRILESVVQDRVTMFFGVPTVFIVLQDQAAPSQLASVRYFFSAAAPLAMETENNWFGKFGAVIHQGYGLTETSPFATYSHASGRKPGSVGMPIEGVEIRILDLASGAPLGPGGSGEIVVRGPNVMLGYWNRPAETASAIRDKWLHTGDIGQVDEEGCLSVKDRLKDMAIVGGFNVYPAEVENALLGHPAVAEAAVYGVPDRVMGERVVAAAVLRKGLRLSTEGAIAHCRMHLAEYKVPAEVQFVESLPKSRTGKVLKRVLREQYSPSRAEQPALAGDAGELQRRIVLWLSEKLNCDARRIGRNVPFAEIGLSSLLAVDLAVQLAQWTGKPVLPTITWQFSTAESLAQHLFDADGRGELEHWSLSEDLLRLSEALSRASEEDSEKMLVAELAHLRH